MDTINNLNDIIQSIKNNNYELFLDKSGNWFFNGKKIIDDNITKLFFKNINKKDDKFFIEIDGLKIFAHVEDAPIFITGVIIEGFGIFETVKIILSSGEIEKLNIDTIHIRNEKELYCYTSKNLLAKFNKSASYTILDRLEENEDVFFIQIAGNKIVLKEKY